MRFNTSNPNANALSRKLMTILTQPSRFEFSRKNFLTVFWARAEYFDSWRWISRISDLRTEDIFQNIQNDEDAVGDVQGIWQRSSWLRDEQLADTKVRWTVYLWRLAVVAGNWISDAVSCLFERQTLPRVCRAVRRAPAGRRWGRGQFLPRLGDWFGGSLWGDGFWGACAGKRRKILIQNSR